MANDDLHLFALVSAENYDTVGRHVPSAEYLAIARAVLPDGWRIQRSEVWFACMPPVNETPAQGWKIHISARLADAEHVLRTAAAVLAEHGIAFKFATDPVMLGRLNGKNWSRSGSGKFVTAYPRDEAEFMAVAKRLADVLRDARGPYILSDRRFGDSTVVHYRYGGFVGRYELQPTGDRRPMIVAPDGTLTPDDRLPFFTTPRWVTDPNGDPGGPGDTTPVLREGRYTIENVLQFSNTGGVYAARDNTTGERVVVKEARPFSGGDGSADSFALLRKEYEVLERLHPTGFAPKPVDLFQEWEHLFLVEEYLEGGTLYQFLAAENKLTMPRVDAETAREFREVLRRLWINIAHGVVAAHDLGVVLGDLTPRNLFVVDANTLAIRFIDFEAAFREGDDGVRMMTPGFASSAHRLSGPTRYEDDYYALGSVMFATLFPLNALFALDPTAADRLLHDLASDIALPASWTAMIAALLDDDPARRPTPSEVIAVLTDRSSTALAPVAERPERELGDAVARIAEHMLASAEYHRRDRLFPGDVRQFTTNPLSLAYGATGVTYALARMTGEVPPRALGWILSHDVTPHGYPAGLYVGASGIAWGLAALGAIEPAARVMAVADTHPQRFALPGVFHGAAGYGLASLSFFQRTGDERYLANAVDAADHLLRTSKVDGDTICWPDADGSAPVGYAYGASGIALFLLYLSLATGEARYLDAGTGALEYDLGQGVSRDGALRFPARSNRPDTVSPYWENGGAGVGTALLRYAVATGDEVYRKTVEQIGHDCSQRWTYMPGLVHGLAGLGNFLLDCEQLLDDTSFHADSEWVARGVRTFAVERPSGVTFPGEMLLRLSTDLATGSAGIGLYLHRLREGGPDFNVTLDELLPRDVC